MTTIPYNMVGLNVLIFYEIWQKLEVNSSKDILIFD